MPSKRKHVSLAYSIRQAKKRKRNQRQRDQRCLGSLSSSESPNSDEVRRDRDAETHRLALLNRARRQLEQERNTAARRQVHVENLQRRRLEEQVN